MDEQALSRRSSNADDPGRWSHRQQDWEQRRPVIQHTKQVGDWILHAEPPDDEGDREIHALTGDGRYVGTTYFGVHPERPGYSEGAPEVHPEHRRRGVGTAMYDFAEEVGGRPMAPASRHTDDAAGFWRSRRTASGPTTINYMHNPAMTPGARDHDFGQTVEPHGRYLTEHGPVANVPEGWQTGQVHFHNPLHLPFGGGYTEPDNWKHQLSRRFDGKTGDELSHAVADAGHDGIITHDRYGTGEIVDLTHLQRRGSRGHQVWYHGLRGRSLDHVLKNGLTPPSGVMPANWPMLTDSHEQAARYAGPGGHVVEFHIPHHLTNYRNEGAVLWPANPHGAYDFDAKAVGVKGTVPPSMISQVHKVPEHIAGADSDAHLLRYQQEEWDSGGSKWSNEGIIRAHHPERGEVGQVRYLRGSRVNSPILIKNLDVGGEHRRRGYGTALMDNLQTTFPKAKINHGDRTNDGKAWWSSYGQGADSRGRTAVRPFVGESLPRKRLFGPTHGLDHRLFDGDHLKHDAADWILRTLEVFWAPVYGPGWRSWARAYLAGSEASEWTSETLEGNNDFDVLVGIDYDEMRKALGGLIGMMTDEQITAGVNKQFRELLIPKTDPTMIMIDGMVTGPWSATWYCNPDSFDIVKIKPYAAYDVTRDRWAVRPPHLPEWSIEDFPEGHALVQECRGYESVVRSILRMPEPFRSQQADALWKHLHSDRGRAFGPNGEGWYDPGNVIEKWLDQKGVWEQLAEAHFDAVRDPSKLVAPQDWSNLPVLPLTREGSSPWLNPTTLPALAM